MNLAAVMDEIAQVVGRIARLNLTAWPAASITPPAGYVSYPQSIDFDESYGRGEDRFTGLPITLLAQSVTERSARDLAAKWAAGDGAQSVKAHMEAHSWKTCDDVTVTSCEFDIEKIGAASYLAVTFRATVVGPGGD